LYLIPIRYTTISTFTLDSLSTATTHQSGVSGLSTS